MNKHALFLDRDGVINRMIKLNGKWDSPRNRDEFTFRDGIMNFMKLAQSKGLKIFVITNQPGVAKNKIEMNELLEIHKMMVHECIQQGIKITKIYTCLHHPDAKEPSFKKKCNCRKPSPGMILEAISEFKLDPEKCYMVGDRSVDILAGRRARCNTILLCWSNLDYQLALQNKDSQPDFAFASVKKLTEFLKEGLKM